MFLSVVVYLSEICRYFSMFSTDRLTVPKYVSNRLHNRRTGSDPMAVSPGISADVRAVLDGSLPALRSAIKTLKSSKDTGDVEETRRAIAETFQLVEEAWVLPTVGRRVAEEICNRVRLDGGLERLLQLLQTPAVEITYESAKLLEQILVSENSEQNEDSGDPTPLSGGYQTSNKLTIQNCISFCRNQRYKLAGMESGYACFCGNDIDYHRHGDAPSTECNHVCFGDHTQPCGGDGRVIVFDTKVGACGGNFTSPSAVIYSPDFPDKYKPGRVCYWTIQVPGASVILFNFTFFNIVDQTDMVELLDGYSNQVLARFDGRNPPRDIVNITADFVILYFYSDMTNEAQGFSVLYHAFRKQAGTPLEEDDDGDEEDASTVQPHMRSTTAKSNTSQKGKSSLRYYVITSSPADMPVWTIYALAALLTLTVIAMVAKLLLHLTVKCSWYV
ncbi:hypothetical protein cypCar_00005657, partial [Cyprinus carpio]